MEASWTCASVSFAVRHLHRNCTSSYLVEVLEIVAKPLVGRRAILKALKVGLELGGRFRGEAIDHPCLMPCALDELVFSQIS